MKNGVDTEKINRIIDWLGMGSINVFGVPLSGKDTQCNNLAKLLGGETFGGGDILRNSKTSAKLKNDIDAGKLAPQDEYLSLILPYFSRQDFSAKPLILSSIGRWKGEESYVIDWANQSGHPIKAVIFLKVSEATAKERLEKASRGRADDDVEKIHTRFTEFKNKTLPVVEHYKKLDLLITVDGNKTKDEVTQQIIDSLYKLAISL